MEFYSDSTLEQMTFPTLNGCLADTEYVKLWSVDTWRLYPNIIQNSPLQHILLLAKIGSRLTSNIPYFIHMDFVIPCVAKFLHELAAP